MFLPERHDCGWATESKCKATDIQNMNRIEMKDNRCERGRRIQGDGCCSIVSEM